MSNVWETTLLGRAYQAIRGPFLGAASRLGIKVSRRSPANDDMVSFARMLADRDVDLILDVGANVGQFGEKVFDAGYAGRIVSYEPLSRPYGILADKCRAHPRWDVVKLSIGDEPGEMEVKISHNEIASSALEFTPELSSYQPEFEYTGSETVEVQTLDQAAGDLIASAARPLLKVDVQGFEEQVLAGGPKTLERCVGLHIELSFIELYRGQMLFSDMLKMLERRASSSTAWPRPGSTRATVAGCRRTSRSSGRRKRKPLDSRSILFRARRWQDRRRRGSRAVVEVVGAQGLEPRTPSV